MSAPKVVHVGESLQYLKGLLKKTTPFMAPRVRMLIEMKKAQGVGVSKRALAELVGVNHNSIQAWRNLYLSGGVTLLVTHKKTGYKPTKISKQEHAAIDRKLRDPQNGIRGYTELVRWLEQEFHRSVSYNTLYKYCVREFGSSVKVARKSHIRKDAAAVEAFKKTSLKPATMRLPAKGGGSRA